ncbi:filamentous hemagglutinin, intein-containing, partial [Pseudomonas amygdali pv. morsprunorum str. M302280]
PHRAQAVHEFGLPAGRLGYDPEVSAKRLGDGLYEQRLVQQAVVAR